MNGIAHFKPKRMALKSPGRSNDNTREGGAMHERSIMGTAVLNNRLET